MMLVLRDLERGRAASYVVKRLLFLGGGRFAYEA